MQYNLSIRWKLLGAFGLAFLVPFGVLWLTGWWSLGLAAGLLTAVLLAWYTVSRVRATIGRLWSIAGRIAGSQAAERGVHWEDELHELVHSFDRFVSQLERTHPQEGRRPPVRREEPVEPGKRAVHRAGLATGNACAGEAVELPRRDEDDLLLKVIVTGPDARHLLEECAEQVRRELTELANSFPADDGRRGIIEFQLLLLDDEALVGGIERCLSDGLKLPESLTAAFGVMLEKLESSPNSYLSSRAADCLDLKQRLLAALYRRSCPEAENVYGKLAGKIVCCQQIYPSEVIALRNVGVKGVISISGTATSHAVILLDAFNLPALVNVAAAVNALVGRQVVLDTVNRVLVINPTPEDLGQRTQQTVLDRVQIIPGPVTLKSGEPVFVRATINNIAVETAKALQTGADGVGLFRSEMTFLGRRRLPDEAELYAEYRQLTTAFAGAAVTLRMLDLGSDKLPTAQLVTSREENPSMGNRSMRLLLRRPEILRLQLRAMLRAATPQCCILYPLISGWDELLQIRRHFAATVAELQAEGQPLTPLPKQGIMVEVPGIVMRFEDYVNEFDVFNIGANDLTQYALAADRNNEDVAEYYRVAHPSLLTMLRKLCDLGRARGKEICLCGELASQVKYLPLLVGLGVHCFSVNYAQVPVVKHALQGLEEGRCRELADQALKYLAASEVEALLARFNAAETGAGAAADAVAGAPNGAL